MQGETVGAQGYANAALAHPEDDLVEQALCAFTNLVTATAVDRGVVAQLSEANSHLAKQLEENATALKEMKALLKK
jgi:phage shock protein A